MEEFKLIVAGGRDFTDYTKASDEIMRLFREKLTGYRLSIVSGLARGADALGYRFAEEHELVCHKFAAKWDEYGKAAGPIRNAEMGDFADGLLAFWDGSSRGTKHMIDYMRKKGKRVRVIRY